MSNIILAILLILNFHPIKIQPLQKSLENFYIKNYIAIKTNSGEMGNISNFEINNIPQKSTASSSEITPKAYISIDLGSGTTLEEKNPNERLQIASLTKMMTAYVVLKEMPLDQKITVPVLNSQINDSVVGLQTGEELTVKEALKGLLIKSGSDAAQTLAIANSGSIEKFVEKMNDTAMALGLSNTHYANPIGWDDKDNYSTARDISTLARILIRNKDVEEIVKTKEANLSLSNGQTHHLENTNQLLDGYFRGVKTGYTFGAGECLAALYVKDEKEILTVVLGSDNRFGETRSLIDWIFTHYLW